MSGFREDSDDGSQQQQKLVETCPQYIAITPVDHNSWPSLKQKLQKMMNQNYSRDSLLQFIEQRYKQKGYSNIRLLRKIKTQYFWASATNFILNCLVNDSEQISCQISILNAEQNTILKLTKYQVFLILGHMLLGTFPPQLYNNDISLGPFMTVYNDEDEVTSKQVLEYRLNKLKSIAKYFCIYKKRSEESASLNKQIIIYQRTHLRENALDVLASSVKFCKVEVKIGEYYEQDRQLNKISINNVSLVQNGQIEQEPIPGFNIYNNQDLHVEERIFCSHPELLIMPLILYRGLGKYETFIVHGAQKYSSHFAISKHTQFDFKVRYFDESQLNKLHNFKNTTLIFIHRQIYTSKRQYDIVPDIMKVCSALKYCSQIRPPSEPLMSGKFTPVKKQKEKISPHRIEIPWQIKFMVDWISASIMNYTNFEFYVESGIEAADIKILVKEMEEYTVRDVVHTLKEYYEFKSRDKSRLDFFEFLKDFVL